MKSIRRCSLGYVFFLLAAGQLLASNKIEKLELFPANNKDVLPEVTVFNGKAKVLKYSIDKTHVSFYIECDNKKVPFRIVDNYIELILFADYYSTDRIFYCESVTSKSRSKVLKINVKQFAYQETELTVPPGKVFLSIKDQKRVAREQKILNSIYAKRTPELLYISAFMIPLSSERTGIYGDKRIFNKKHPSTHLGNDFRAAVGTEIPSANDGIIAYVGDLFYSGKTVIIDHGMQLFSMYAHLSEIKTKIGAKVTKGEIIGLSGATGRASGPHLHWGIKINGDWIDGFSLVEEYNTITLLSENESHTKM